jgi:integrase/recombinase XerD
LRIYDDLEWELVSKIIPRIQKRPFPILTKEEFEKLLTIDTVTDQLTNERNNIIIKFFWFLGIRVSELINARHSDYREGDLRVHGKWNKVRYIPIPPFLLKYFDPCSRNYLFLTKSSKQLTEAQIRRNLQRQAKRVGIKKNISPHTFRRSFATNSYNLGIRLDAIQKQLGHSDINTTLDYIHNDYQSFYQDCSKLWENANLTLLT